MAKLKVNLNPALLRLQITTQRTVTSGVIGNYKSVFKGRGLEFAQYRAYSESDDASTIDWKASVRTNSILVKEFEEERNLNVFLLIDVSESMVFGSVHKLKNEYTAELAASITYTVLQAGDSIGFAFFSDKIGDKSPPRKGPAQFYKLSKVITETKIYGGGYNLEKALRFVSGYLKEHATIIIISDFIGLKGEWQKYLKILAQKFEVIGMMVRDPIDRYLPDVSGNIIFADPFSERQIVVDVELVKPQYRDFVKRQEEALKNIFIKSKADFLPLSTEESFVKPITDFFKKRELMKR